MTASTEVTQIPTANESASTLRTIVDLVRRILRADMVSIVHFSLPEGTITWKVASGLKAHSIDADNPLVRSLANELAQRSLGADSTIVLEGIGVREDLPAEAFPLHSVEGIRDLALTPLRSGGEVLGALVAGYRSTHHFSEEEKQQLQDLAAMASLAMENTRLLETLEAARTIWEQTFNSIGEGIIVHDAEGVIIRCNTMAAEMMSLDPNEVIGQSFKDAFAVLFGRRAAEYYLAEARGLSSLFEVQTDIERRFLVSIFPIRKPDGEAVTVVTWSDVTRLSEIQEQLARTRRLASVGQLAAGVAHEINNPLAAITTCAEATMRDMRQADDTRELAETHQWNYYLEEIVRQALRCKEITRGLLDLTRQRKARRVMCDVNLTAKQCAKVAVQRAGSAAEFEIDLDETIGEVATDATMLRQILDNLFSNAIDALAGNVGKVKLSTHRDGDRVSIDVSDTGMGVAPELMSRIFDPFFSTKGPGKGYGLGLAISLSLAESLGGALTVGSKENEGSVFRLWIPRRGPEE
jgi:PAS domain S-box-containing protein